VLDEVLYADTCSRVLFTAIFVLNGGVQGSSQLFGFDMSSLTWFDISRGSRENILVWRVIAVNLIIILFAHFDH
jgi:hypothetical protein